MNKNSSFKLMTILGTRPEIIRLSRVLPRLDKYFNHCVVFTKQSFDFELSDIFFQELELREPDFVLDVKSETVGGQIGNILKQAEEVLLRENPDALLILGDTNSALAAIIAKRLKIPIFHMEAGNRSFDWNVPEEINRRIVDHISDYNLAYTEHARRYLINEGLSPQRVFVTGSPLQEVFSHFAQKVKSSSVLQELSLQENNYILVSTHREENVDNEKNLRELFSSFDYLSSEYNMPIVVSLHPRTKKRMEAAGISVSDKIKLLKPLGYLEFNQLQNHAFCVVSDSGSIQEESAILRFPAVQIRVSTERPEAFDAGSIVVCGFEKEALKEAIQLAVDTKNDLEIPIDYQSKNVSIKVTKIILGLTALKKNHKRAL